MTTTTQITNIAHLLDLTAYAGEFIDDYDMDAVHADYVAAINAEILPESVTVYANGDVIADIETADAAREIDWKTVADDVNAAPIFKRHDITTRITMAYDEDGFGKVIRQGHDRDGNLIVAWGPDTRDENGDLVDEISDEHWIATSWDGDNAAATLAGTRAEVEAWAYSWMKTYA